MQASAKKAQKNTKSAKNGYSPEAQKSAKKKRKKSAFALAPPPPPRRRAGGLSDVPKRPRQGNHNGHQPALWCGRGCGCGRVGGQGDGGTSCFATSLGLAFGCPVAGAEHGVRRGPGAVLFTGRPQVPPSGTAPCQ